MPAGSRLNTGGVALSFAGAAGVIASFGLLQVQVAHKGMVLSALPNCWPSMKLLVPSRCRSAARNVRNRRLKCVYVAGNVKASG